jgi:hypothetical protein
MVTIFAIAGQAAAGEIEEECPASCGFSGCRSSDLCQDEMTCKDQDPECSECEFTASCISGECPPEETMYQCCASSPEDFGGCEVN